MKLVVSRYNLHVHKNQICIQIILNFKIPAELLFTAMNNLGGNKIYTQWYLCFTEKKLHFLTISKLAACTAFTFRG